MCELEDFFYCKRIYDDLKRIYDDLKRPYLGLLSDSDVAKLLNYKSKMADNNMQH